MTSLTIGDIVENSAQRAFVRWMGLIQETPIIGLQLIDSTLPGYTDGICPLDNNRYFTCPDRQGYYVLENSFHDFYHIIRNDIENDKTTGSNVESNSAEHSLSASPVNTPVYLHPIHSFSSPNMSQNLSTSNTKDSTSPSRGILSRLAFEREQRNTQMNSSVEEKKSTTVNASSVQSEPDLSRIYRPEYYRSTSNERIEELITNNFFMHESNDDNDDNHDSNNHNPLFEITDTHEPSTASRNLPLFGHEYFLNDWTLQRIKLFLHKEVPIHNQLCLNIFNNECNVQSVIDEQIHGCSPKIPSEPPKDISFELIRLFDNVKIIFPSRAIHLYNCDYLLLAILCSNNQCAYVRTSIGWAYTDDDSEDGRPFVVDEISDMIDDRSNDAHINSEQCLHLLQNASYLYYKLVE